MDVDGNGTVVVCTGANAAACLDNEMGYHYWENGITQASAGVFNNVLSGYWSSTTANSEQTHTFNFNGGANSLGGTLTNNFPG